MLTSPVLRTRRLLRIAALALWMLASPDAAAATGVRDIVSGYLDAEAQGRVGTVSGLAYGEGTGPTAVAAPVPGLQVVLVPWSERFVAELEVIRSASRESGARFVASGPDLAEARSRYEAAIVEAGGGAMVRTATTDKDGRFTIVDLPAGRWVLLGSLETPHAVASRRITRKEARQFPGNPQRAGYTAVSYWLVVVELRAGERSQIRLSDRAVWMTAVAEERWESSPQGSRKGHRGATR